MFEYPKLRHKASARAQLDIEQVQDSILCLPNKRYRVLLHVSAVNFELKSDEEQDAVIETYESFLNSVGFPLQIVIRTREIDMDNYLHDLADQTNQEDHPVYKQQLENYQQFIRSLVRSNKILTRHFYIVIPWQNSEGMDFEHIKEQLLSQADIVSRGLARLGMHSRILSNLDILELFYSFYSPRQSKIQPLSDQAVQLVQSLFITKEEA